jgi:polyhydroxyalkanoate synthesis regulator phasin
VEESEKLAKELVDEGEGQWKELREEMQGMVRATLDELDIGSKKEFEELKSRLASIEQRLTMIEDRLAGPAPGDPGHA